MRRFTQISLLTFILTVGSFLGLARTAAAQYGIQQDVWVTQTGLAEELSSSCSPQFAGNHCCGLRSVAGSGSWSFFSGVDGSKQPQDFGANAHLGLRTSIDYAASLNVESGIGFQVGTAAVFHGNAVQVFELLGESKDRFQSFTTLGLFQRSDSGLTFAATYDLLVQDSFDDFRLGQWRLLASIPVNANLELGTVVNLAADDDTGQFTAGGSPIDVRLEPIEQLKIFLRTDWQSSARTTFWVGVADEHSEENVVTGTLPPKNNQILFGADLFAPLNRCLALYGETNLMMPADTGAVDAWLGIQFVPGGLHFRDRTNRFRPALPVASNTTFANDLMRLR